MVGVKVARKKCILGQGMVCDMRNLKSWPVNRRQGEKSSNTIKLVVPKMFLSSGLSWGSKER